MSPSSALVARLSPTHKRLLAILAAAAVLITVLYLTAGDPTPRERRGAEPGVQSILIDRDTRELSIESLSAQLRMLRDEQERMRRERERDRTELERARAQADRALGRDGQRAHAEAGQLADQVRALERQLAELRREPAVRAAEGVSRPVSSARAVVPAVETVEDEHDLFGQRKRQPSLHLPEERPDRGVASSYRRTDPEQRATRGIRRVAATPSEGRQAPEAADAAHDDGAVHIPLGSIITAVLLTGVDAPTGQKARSEPTPVLARIKKEAILPNRYHADIRECFVLLAGHGDLSSERAYLRGDSISCIRTDGEVLEANLRAYAVGEDGKSGVRGRLVSKQGALLARAMTAGFLDGVAKAFSYAPVPTVLTERSDAVPYQRVMSTEAAQSASLHGAGKALERLADYYLRMADAIYPVIEIDAGREVHVVLTTGLRLQVRS